MSCADDYCEIEYKPVKAGVYQKKAIKAASDGRDSYRLGTVLRKSFDMEVDIPELLNGLLGLAGESGEVCDLFKKWIFQEAPFDEIHAKRELGDVCWYIALICHAMGWSMDDILQMNLDKIAERYPSGFDVEHANNRAEGDN